MAVGCAWRVFSTEYGARFNLRTIKGLPMSLGQRMLQRVSALVSAPGNYLRQREAMRRAEQEARRREIEEEIAAQYQVWFPRLQEFAEECRRKTPIPDVSEFSAVEREQYRILREAMENKRESEDLEIVLRRRPHCVPILYTSRVGLPAAHALYGDTGAVILEESEQQHWLYEVYQLDGPEWGCRSWWFAFAWWTVSEEIPEDLRKHLRPAITALPAGSTYWMQWSGVQWGELHGGSRGSLWRWDGTRAEFDGACCDESY
jgi:hypothetical protein